MSRGTWQVTSETTNLSTHHQEPSWSPTPWSWRVWRVSVWVGRGTDAAQHCASPRLASSHRTITANWTSSGPGLSTQNRETADSERLGIPKATQWRGEACLVSQVHVLSYDTDLGLPGIRRDQRGKGEVGHKGRAKCLGRGRNAWKYVETEQQHSPLREVTYGQGPKFMYNNNKHNSMSIY